MIGTPVVQSVAQGSGEYAHSIHPKTPVNCNPKDMYSPDMTELTKQPKRMCNTDCSTQTYNLANIVLIQRLIRGYLGRLKAKRMLLQKAWQELDTKEEGEIATQHRCYVEMCQSLKNVDEMKEAQRAPSHDFEQQQHTRMNLLHVQQEFRETSTPLPSVSASIECVNDDDRRRAEHFPRATLVPLSATNPISLKWVLDLRDDLAEGFILNAPQLDFLIASAYEILVEEPNLNTVVIPSNGKLTIVGDIHGQLADLLSIFRLNGNPSPTNLYIFNGDWVDRGQASCECITLLLAWKVLYPHYVFLNRGNHESRSLPTRDGFVDECFTKYGPGLFDLFVELFTTIPLGCIVRPADGANKPGIVVLHGGLPRGDITIEDIQRLDRSYPDCPPNSDLEALLWSDPCRRNGLHPSARGAGKEFGADVTYEFLSKNKMCMLFRSHECCDNGWALSHNNMCVTVFSASNYCGLVGNHGAFAVLESNLRPTFVTYMAQREVLATRTSLRYKTLETDIVRKLMDRIAVNRLDLLREWSIAAQQNRERAAKGENVLQTTAAIPLCADIISRSQWSDGLKRILRLNIPFLKFQDQLGLPGRGVLGDEKGPINYLEFLSAFRPKLDLVASSAFACTDTCMESTMDTLALLILAHRYELEGVFRFLDFDNNRFVSRDEFILGILALVHLFQKKAEMGLEDCSYIEGMPTDILEQLRSIKWNRKHIEDLADYIDINQDGVIQYTEFIGKFSYKARTMMSD